MWVGYHGYVVCARRNRPSRHHPGRSIRRRQKDIELRLARAARRAVVAFLGLDQRNGAPGSCRRSRLIWPFGWAGSTKGELAPQREILGSTQRLNGVRPGNPYLTYTDAFPFMLAGVPGLAAYQDCRVRTNRHSAADILDKVQAGAIGAASLEDRRGGHQLLGLWPF